MSHFRADIEGLRAIAVGSILLFHFGYAGLGGGYVGVDVFFVISGFLIGRSAIGQVLDGSFSLWGFWERRVRRLYPALIAMLLVIAAAAPLLLLPMDLMLFGKSLVATAGYASNILFLKEAGYFDQSAILKPLLHTWSLAVEEQFYVALPLLVLAMGRLKLARGGMLAVLGALALASFAAALWWMGRNPSAAFYLFPLRAWELLGGVLAGAAGWQALAARRRMREALAGAGAALILGSILLYAPDTRFPGWGAVPPVLGTLLVIVAGSGGTSLTGRMLGAMPLRWLGRVSYSLYLWHWPLVVLLAYYHGGTPLPQSWRLSGIGATLLLAMLSYRYVETPFRAPRGHRVRLFAGAAAASLVSAAIGLLFYYFNGLPNRFSPGQRTLATAASDFLQQRGTCFEADNPTLPGLAYCRLGDPARAPDFLVWGDSHGRAFRDGIDLAATEHHRAGILVWSGGCPPLIALHKSESANTPDEDRRCFAQSARLLAFLRTDHALRDVLLIGRWAYYAEGRGIGSDAANRLTLSIPGEDKPQDRLLSMALVATARLLHAQGRRVFVLEQVPEIGGFSARALAQRVLARRELLRDVLANIGFEDRQAMERRQRAATGTLLQLSGERTATIIHTHRIFCDATRCSAWIGGRPFLFDNNHVTVAASLRLRGLFDPLWTTGPQSIGAGPQPRSDQSIRRRS